MRSVHKLELERGLNTFYMSPLAKVLFVADQQGTLQMWVETDPYCAEDKKVRRVFSVFGTGYPIQDVEAMEMTHVGSTLFSGGAFTWHVYEGRPLSSG